MKRWAGSFAGQLASIGLLCLAGYSVALSRYFVSEDFVVLRFFARESVGSALWMHLTGPVLGAAIVPYYRPVAYFLLNLENLLWSTTPGGYLWTHFLLHLANVGLVLHLARIWSKDRGIAWGIALIFALYPIHPNTVVFIAAFATLYSTTLLLFSMVLYERHRAGGGGATMIGAALCFLLAMGCYEQAVVLPAIVGLREMLALPCDGGGKVSATLGRLGLLGCVLCLWLIFRTIALGGHSLVGERLGGIGWSHLGRGLVEGGLRLAFPAGGYRVSPGVISTATILLVAASLWSVVGWRRGQVGSWLWLFGVGWVLFSQAPFQFGAVVPATGRYWYLTSIGLGLLIGGAALALGQGARLAGLPLQPRRTAAVLMTAFGLLHLPVLTGYAKTYREAGDATRRLQGQLLELDHGERRRIFLTGYREFLRDPRGVPVAQVFHWGLSDALMPPFVSGNLELYPLKTLAEQDLVPLLERPDLGEVWRWDQESSALERLHLPESVAVPRLSSRLRRAPAGGRAGGPGLAFRAVPASDHRLVLLTRGNPSFHPIETSTGESAWSRVPWPGMIVETMQRVYGSPMFAWIEARGPDGGLKAVSRLHEVVASRESGVVRREPTEESRRKRADDRENRIGPRAGDGEDSFGSGSS